MNVDFLLGCVEMRFYLLAIFLVFNSVSASEVASQPSYEDVERLLISGKCEDYESVAKENRRFVSLLFLEDVLLSVRGHDGFVHRFVGDMHVFKIGRKVDPVLVKLYSYSTRKDVAAQVDKDIESITTAIGGYVPDTKEQKGSDVLTALLCNIGGMLAGENYYLKDELDSYFNDINRRIMRINVDKLSEIVDEV